MSAVDQFISSRLDRLPRHLALRWPGGQAGASESSVVVRMRNKQFLVDVAHGDIGALADAYVRGDLDIEGSLADLMAVAGALVGNPVQRGSRVSWMRWMANLRSRWSHSPLRDEHQIRVHYDVSDEFYGLWLDPLRVYSCAYYAEPGASLSQAQEAKLDLICRKLQLRRGQRFLDIGAGWGGLLLWAAQNYGVRATGVTLSRNQHAYVNNLIDASGLNGQVEMRLLDYRSLESLGQFDRIASVGMFEHVGRAQIDSYFRLLERLLRPGGLLLNHAIAAGGIDNRELGAGMGDFIEKHIFPGGELVHVTRAAEGLARGGLELLDAENLRPHYARTLWAWSDNLEHELERARMLVDEATLRAYRLYLAGSAMCFEHGWLSLYQLLAARADGTTDVSRSWAARSDHSFVRDHARA